MPPPRPWLPAADRACRGATGPTAAPTRNELAGHQSGLEVCWRRPVFSGTRSYGSGIEFFDVSYNRRPGGHRANVPILNVEYGPGGCGCFRDWLYEDQRFEAIGSPACADGYCEVTQPPRTVCDCADQPVRRQPK